LTIWTEAFSVAVRWPILRWMVLQNGRLAMRLTNAQRTEIVELAKRRFGGRAVVRLFGSRTQDDRLGGDIDLHIQAESADLANFANELDFTVELKDRIGDEKIDVIVRGPGHSPRGIDDVALRTGMIL